MQRLNNPLKKYIKAVELIATEKGLSHVKWKETHGSVVRFEIFEKNENTPCAFWVVHHEHNRQKNIYSKEDYRKAAVRLNCTLEELVKKIESL